MKRKAILALMHCALCGDASDRRCTGCLRCGSSVSRFHSVCCNAFRMLYALFFC